MKSKSKLMLTAVMLLGASLHSFGQDNLVLAPSNRSTTSLEKNLLFNATNFYTVTQSGGISLGLDGFFDGYFEPQYSGALSEANPYVVVIEGLPNKHVQTGAWIGWTTRAYQPIKFKIEVYNVYDYGIPGYPAPNTWVTVAEESDYSKNQYLTQVSSVAVAKIRFTFYKGAGPSNSIGISELFFIHPEAVKAYDNLMVQYSTNGNVGIGSTVPTAKFTVVGGSLATAGGGLSISSSLNTGRLTSGLVNSIHNFLDQESLELSSGSTQKTGIAIEGQTSSLGSTIRMFTGNEERLRMNTAGNLLIGKTTQTNTAYKIDVNGKVRANEIVVKTTGADFVFEENYRLRPLAEVEKFVRENKHLPEISTAKAMQLEGVGVSELQTKLLQKVEELTLYLIEMKKENEKLRKRIVQLEKKAQ